MIDTLLKSTIFVQETVKCQFTEVQLLRKCIFIFLIYGLFQTSV